MSDRSHWEPRTLPRVDDDPGPASTTLRVAALLVGLEVLALLAVGATVLGAGSRARLVMDVTTVAFFLIYAGGLLTCVWGLARMRRWARGPVVLAQLIQLGVAWDFRGGATQVFGGSVSSTTVSWTLAGVAVLVLALVLTPGATQALVDDDVP